MDAQQQEIPRMEGNQYKKGGGDGRERRGRTARNSKGDQEETFSSDRREDRLGRETEREERKKRGRKRRSTCEYRVSAMMDEDEEEGRRLFSLPLSLLFIPSAAEKSFRFMRRRNRKQEREREQTWFQNASRDSWSQCRLPLFTLPVSPSLLHSFGCSRRGTFGRDADSVLEEETVQSSSS
jgi:hypothetical protein